MHTDTGYEQIKYTMNYKLLPWHAHAKKNPVAMPFQCIMGCDQRAIMFPILIA